MAVASQISSPYGTNVQKYTISTTVKPTRTKFVYVRKGGAGVFEHGKFVMRIDSNYVLVGNENEVCLLDYAAATHNSNMNCERVYTYQRAVTNEPITEFNDLKRTTRHEFVALSGAYLDGSGTKQHFVGIIDGNPAAAPASGIRTLDKEMEFSMPASQNFLHIACLKLAVTNYSRVVILQDSVFEISKVILWDAFEATYKGAIPTIQHLGVFNQSADRVRHFKIMQGQLSIIAIARQDRVDLVNWVTGALIQDFRIVDSGISSTPGELQVCLGRQSMMISYHIDTSGVSFKYELFGIDNTCPPE